MTPAQEFINDFGIIFRVVRNGINLFELKGRPTCNKETKRNYISFMPDSDIKPGDWILNPKNEKLYVQDTITSYFFGEASELQAYFQTDTEYKSNTESNTNIFNINTATNSIIGTQANVTMNINNSIQDIIELINASNSNDKDELCKIIKILESAFNEQIPIKKGMLSKFSDVMERNSWITGSISSLILNWMLSQIH